MLVLFEKMALLVIILAIGYICAKIKLVGPEFNKGLSKMVINVFLAGMILASVMNKELSMDKGDMLFGIAMLFVMQIVLCRRHDNSCRNENKRRRQRHV